MFKAILSSLFLLLVFQLQAQHLVQGRVYNAKTKEAVAGATVYINNSSIGTSTDKSGAFKLSISQSSFYELVVSAMGYHGSSTQVKIPDTKSIDIALQEKSTEIEEVVITGIVKDGWKKWGKYFTETLIGIGYNAEKTKILNPEVIRFQYEDKARILRAYALEPIKVSNDALGYDIEYDLQDFRSAFADNYIYFAGYAYFKDKGKGRSKYKNARRDTYELSLAKFLQSAYLNTWEKEGYVVRKMVKKENETRKVAIAKLKEVTGIVVKSFQGNWNAYYASQKEILPTHVQAWRTQSREAPEIAYLMGTLTLAELFNKEPRKDKFKQLQFQDFLYIIYPSRLAKSKNKMLKAAASQVTELTLTHPNGIMVDPSGAYFPTENLLLIGYGVNYSRLAFLLPLDYVPPIK